VRRLLLFAMVLASPRGTGTTWGQFPDPPDLASCTQDLFLAEPEHYYGDFSSVFTTPHCSGNGLLLRDGSAVESVVDLVLEGPGARWTHRRTYNSRVTGSTSLGNRWFGGDADVRLRQAGTNVEVLLSALSKRTFAGSMLTPPVDTHLRLVHEPALQEYVLTNEKTGDIWLFHDFTVVTPLRGKLKQRTSRVWRVQVAPGQAKLGAVFSYDANGRLVGITAPARQNATISFEYLPDSPDKISQVHVCAGTETQRVEYTYKSASHAADVGSDGDLVQVKTSVRVTNGVD
jgi:hypothetical protein